MLRVETLKVPRVLHTASIVFTRLKRQQSTSSVWRSTSTHKFDLVSGLRSPKGQRALCPLV